MSAHLPASTTRWNEADPLRLVASAKSLAIAGSASFVLYGMLAFAGDLRAHLSLYLVVHGLLCAVYVWALSAVGFFRPEGGSRRAFPTVTPPGDPRPGLGEDASASGRGAASTSESVAGAGAGPSADASGRSRAARVFSPAALMVLFAIAFRVLLIASSPSLSDDIARYFWDGRVQTHGINPYRYAPDAEELRPLRDAEWHRINHRQIPTIYPPLMQAVFFAGSLLGLGIDGFRVMFCLFDGAVVAGVAALLRARGRPPHLALAYAWHPVAVVEVASSGHCDPVGVSLLVISTALLLTGRQGSSAAAYGASVAARLLPLVVLPVMARSLRLRHLAIALALVGMVTLPYVGIGAGHAGMFTGLGVYAANWDYNSVVFPVLERGLERIVPVDALKGLVTALKDRLGDPAWCQALYRWVWPAPLTRAILALAMVIGSVLIARRVPGTLRALLLTIGLALVLSPTLHPWYILWILPFAVVERSWPWLVFTLLVPLSYLSVHAPGGRCPPWILALEFGLPALLAIALWLRRVAMPPIMMR